MIIRQTATGLDLTPELERYATKKIKQLGRIVPRPVRKHTICHVDFSRKVRGAYKYNTCTLTLEITDAQLRAVETTQHMYASLDVAAVHMQHQLGDYAARIRKRRIRRMLHH